MNEEDGERHSSALSTESKHSKTEFSAKDEDMKKTDSDTSSAGVSSNYYCPVLKNQVVFDEEFGLFLPSKDPKMVKCKKEMKRLFTSCSCLEAIQNFVPILRWLPSYNIRKNVIGDITGGLTIGIMNVSQGMAYASLAGLDPINGLYTSFFPALVYMFFGTSPHVSLGVFAVVSLMVGTTNLRVTEQLNIDMAKNFTMDKHVEEVRPIEVVTALGMLIGMIQLSMGFLRLDFLMEYMSDQVIKGFTTGAAFHVFVAQLNKIMGVSLPRNSGFGKLFKTVRDLILQVQNINFYTLSISLVTIVLLYICKNPLNRHVKKYISIPIPYDLFVIVSGIVLSHVLKLESEYNVKIIGKIPVGFVSICLLTFETLAYFLLLGTEESALHRNVLLDNYVSSDKHIVIPPPTIPSFKIFPYIISDAFAIAIIILTVTISLGSLFAKKNKYKIDMRQEFCALGITEIVSSLFPCWPSSAALARSLVYEAAGTKTQLAAIFSSILLLLVIFLIGPLMEALPVCFLSCVIIVALRGMFLQFGELKNLWPVSKADFVLWLLSFLSTVVYDVIQGLMIGVFCSIAVLIFRIQRLKAIRMARIGHRERTYYRPCDEYRSVDIVPGVCFLRYIGPIVFSNAKNFKESCLEQLNMPTKSLSTLQFPSKSLQSASDHLKHIRISEGDLDENIISKSHKTEDKWKITDPKDQYKNIANGQEFLEETYAIIDLSGVPFIDFMGSVAIIELHQEMKERGVNVYFADIQLSVRRFLKRAIEADNRLMDNAVYPSVDDALDAIKKLSHS